jgi:hypothetical protein
MTFLSWLVDDNCFHIESDYNALSHDKARKCIAVVEMIISLHKKFGSRILSLSINHLEAKNKICLTRKTYIVNVFLFSKRSWCKMSKNFLNAIS